MDIENFIKQHPARVLLIAVLLFVLIRAFINHLKQKRRKKREEERFLLSVSINSKTATPPKEVDLIQKVASKMELSPAEVKVMLGIPLSFISIATTVAMAEEEFYKADAGSDQEYAALLKWIELENNPANMDDLWDQIEDYPTLCPLLDAKWAPLSLEQIKKIKTEEDFDNAFDAAPKETQTELVKVLYALYQK